MSCPVGGAVFVGAITTAIRYAEARTQTASRRFDRNDRDRDGPAGRRRVEVPATHAGLCP
jgi:hypothetical protein